MTNEIATHDTQYAWDMVKKICTQVGPGLPATVQERQRAEMIKKELEAHLGELKQLDTSLLNYEIVTHPEISILSSDLNGTVKYSPEMARSVVADAQRTRVPYKIGSGIIGAGSDAVPYSQAGIKSIKLLPFKSPQQMFAFYYQDHDTPLVLTLSPLLNALKLTLE
jgi:hypothetical protein